MKKLKLPNGASYFLINPTILKHKDISLDARCHGNIIFIRSCAKTKTIFAFCKECLVKFKFSRDNPKTLRNFKMTSQTIGNTLSYKNNPKEEKNPTKQQGFNNLNNLNNQEVFE